MKAKEVAIRKRRIADFMGLQKCNPIQWTLKANGKGGYEDDYFMEFPRNSPIQFLKGSCEESRLDSYLSFDTDWGWIMAVWEKIAKLKSKKFEIDEMEIGSNGCCIKAHTLPYPYKAEKSLIAFYVTGEVLKKSEKVNKLIDATFLSIAEFVEWHNEKIKK